MPFNTRYQTSLLLTVSIVIMVAPASAQWVKVPPLPVPAGPDGKPNLTAPAPRAPDGHPDLSGIWEAVSTKYLNNLAADMKPEDIPYQPWAKALVESRAGGAHAREESDANCLPPGVPKTAAAPPPWKILQTPTEIAILHEAMTLWRQIFTDGREFAADLNPSWLGFSIGKWDGDTLVVESRGFNGKTWLDKAGNPTTEALHVTERFRRRNIGTLEIQVTIDDPMAYTRPWMITEQFRLMTNGDLLESICENNKDLEHLPGSPLR
jgi:hypothetical protein